MHEENPWFVTGELMFIFRLINVFDKQFQDLLYNYLKKILEHGELSTAIKTTIRSG
jgi:hypothetical protein